jgi:hypothetical protein
MASVYLPSFETYLALEEGKIDGVIAMVEN